jgi:hypothetical protein
MIFDATPGDVVECLRDHMAFTKAGKIADLREGELLIVVEAENFIGTALRVNNSELVSIMFLEALGTIESYRRIWP